MNPQSISQNHLYAVSLLDILLRICKVQCVSVQFFCTCSGYDIPSCSHKRSIHSMSSMLPQVWSNVVHIDQHQSSSNPNCLEKKAQGVEQVLAPRHDHLGRQLFWHAVPEQHVLVESSSRMRSPCKELLPSFVYIGAGAGSDIHKYDEPINNMHGLFGYLSGSSSSALVSSGKEFHAACSLLAMSNKCWHSVAPS